MQKGTHRHSSIKKIYSINDIEIINVQNPNFDSNGQEKQSLKSIYQYGEKMVIFDNHHHALYLWAQFLDGTQQSLPVIHIDQHSDMKTPAGWDLEKVPHTTLSEWKYITYQISDIGSFIVPALESGLISECIQLRTETSLLEFSIPQHEYILDIDLDFRAPEMINDHILETLEKTRNLIRNASLITIATSPGYINQELALAILKKLVQ